MDKNKTDTPLPIKLTPEQANALRNRVKQSNLTEEDAKILLGLLSFALWLQQRLSRAKLSLKRLRQLFGFKNESRKKSKENHDKEDSQDNETNNPPSKEGEQTVLPTGQESSNDPPVENSLPPKWDDSKNHGRLGTNDYRGCIDVEVAFEDPSLLAGKCPDCASYHTDANIYPLDPSVIVLLDSQPLVCGTRYHLQKARCCVCQQYFTAPSPNEVGNQSKYSPRAKTTIAIHHYYGGMPFKRLEMMQAAQGVPLADATQYDLMRQLYRASIQPVAQALRECAANGHTHYFDDTVGRVLEQMAINKLAAPKDKKGVHATAMLSLYEGHRIYLFDTNTLTAGKQLQSLLKQRTVEEDFTTMSDASPNNFPTLDDNLAAHWVISLCLSHGRRRFMELLNEDDDDIVFILDLIGQVYEHERYCKIHQLDAQQRLHYHQQYSEPLMEAMRIWLNNLVLFKHVEPNSRLGEAILYMLKRWFWLTQFLRVPGAPMDNNLCEQTIKVAIRYRKNALFYRTFYGATIGDAMMGVMHTAVHAGANLFDYLNTLQVYAEEVQRNAHDWLPWNYHHAWDKLSTKPAGECAR